LDFSLLLYSHNRTDDLTYSVAALSDSCPANPNPNDRDGDGVFNILDPDSNPYIR